MSKIVITGIGVISSLGVGHEEYWDNAVAGKNGVDKLNLFDTSELGSSRGGELWGFKAKNHLPKKGLKYLGRGIAMTLIANNLAIEDAGLDLEQIPADRIGVALGTNSSCVANMQKFDEKAMTIFPDPVFFPNTGISAPACQVSIHKGFHCYTSTYTTGLSGALDAISSAARELRDDRCDYVLAGGVEEIAEIIYRGAIEEGQLQKDDLPWFGPFHEETQGQLPGEGCAVLVLEREETARARGANILAELGEYAVGYDPNQLAKGKPDPAIAARIIKDALNRQGLEPGDVDYVSSGAYGDPEADAGEEAALSGVFGEKQVPVGAVSSLLGNTFGASGAFQAITAVLAMKNGRLPGGITNAASSSKHLDLVGASREHQTDTALLTTFGEHGDRAALILKKYNMEEAS